MGPTGLNNLLGVVQTEEIFVPEQRGAQKRPLDKDIEKIAKKGCSEKTAQTSSSSSFQASIGRATDAVQVACATLLPEAKQSSLFTFQFYRNDQPVDNQNYPLDLALLQANCPGLYNTFFCYQAEKKEGFIFLDCLPGNCQDMQKWRDLLMGFTTLKNPINSENVLDYLPYLHYANMHDVLRNTISELEITSENFQQLCQIACSLRLAILADRLLVYAQETIKECSEDLLPSLQKAFSQLGRFRPTLMLRFSSRDFDDRVERQKLILSSFKNLESLTLYFSWLGKHDAEACSVEAPENNELALRYVRMILDHLRTLHTPDHPLKLKELRLEGSPSWIAEHRETLSFIDGGLSLFRVRDYVAEILKEPKLPLTKLYLDMNSRDVEVPETCADAIEKLVEILTPVKAAIPSLGLRLNTLKLSETLLQKLQDLNLQELKEGYSYNLEYEEEGYDDILVSFCYADDERSDISINESVLSLVNSLLRYTTRVVNHTQSWDRLEELQLLNIHFIDSNFLLEHLQDERLKHLYSLDLAPAEAEEAEGAPEVVQTTETMTWESFIEHNMGLFRNRKHPEVQAFEAAIGALSVKKLSINYPHCNINRAIEKWIKEGLKNLEELTIVGYKGSVNELQAILSQRTNLKYTIFCDVRWAPKDAEKLVYTRGQKFLHKGEIK